MIVFIIPNKEGTVRFITDYHRLNKQLVQKKKKEKKPMPRIGNTMQKFELFQYDTEIDLKIGYYTIKFSPESRDMATIFTKSGIFRYICLPMSMCTSGYYISS